ncbi:MAG: C-type lectin domain-containing protein [Synechococcaceae cyanobacterium]|nr:C-type lectin domain-containing protein [Synechococcaceae cyanobacterium]
MVLLAFLKPAAASTITRQATTIYNGARYDSYLSTQPLSWSEARAHAQSLGTDLVSFNSEAENQAIFDRLGSNPQLWGDLGPYIGLFQPAGSAESIGNWQWVDGTSLTDANGKSLSYSNWSWGQPDNYVSDNVATLFSNGSIGSSWGDTLDNNAIFTSNSFLTESNTPTVPAPLPLLGLTAALAHARRLKHSGTRREP